MYHGTADPILLFNGGVDTSALAPIVGSDPDFVAEEPDFTVVEPGEDPTVELDGPGYPETARTFAAANGCDADPTDTDVTDEVLLRTYDCPTDADVEFYIVREGGHAWPGSAFSQNIESVVGLTTMDIDATKLGWTFMSRFALSHSG